MTLQQLRYLIAVAEHGSINAAAHALFVAQSSLSAAVKDAEEEAGITIFQRSNKGVVPTADGVEYLGFARQVVEQADLMARRYDRSAEPSQRLAVSTQHYTFCVEAFVDLVEEQQMDEYSLVLRETSTGAIIDDVREFRSDIGVLYLDRYNERVLRTTLSDASLVFTPLFRAKPHVFVGEHHPLASAKRLKMEDLEPYARYSFEQGTDNSFYFSEEPFSYLPHKRNIVISDRGTLSNLLTNHTGYTISTGVLSSEMHTGIVSIPLDTDDEMNVGYILHAQRRPSALVNAYIDALKRQILAYGVASGEF
ncbi:MAG: LysR family transcriptional regulator [Eggerthellales bacterium]|nr:LysR family transcriptional regulator [Eggerthellales bacterium]